MNMRDLINLCESISPQLRARISDELKDIHTSDPDWYGTDDNAVIIPKILDEIDRLFAGGSAILYRALLIPDDVLKTIQPTASIGPLDANALTSWTSDFSEMDFNSTYAFDIHGEDDEAKMILFTAKVPFAAVALKETVLQRIRLPWEQEIVTRRGHNVECLKVTEVDNYGNSKRTTRPDLRGAILRT